MQTLKMPAVGVRADIAIPLSVDRHEIKANRFAAEWLMPYKILLQDLQRHGIDLENEEAIKTLAKRYGVSVQAMTYRIANLVEDRLNLRRR